MEVYMKKLYLLMMLLTLTVTLVGCSQTNKSTSNASVVDKTVAINSFNPDNFSNKIVSKSSLDFEKIYENMEQLNADAPNIVYGTVKEVKNFDESGSAMTCYNLLVEKSYKGNLNENDMVSILAIGGYVRLEKYIEVFGDGKFSDYSSKERQTTVIEENPMDVPVPQVGDKYLVFLSEPIKNEAPFPDGTYSEVGSFMGRYYDNDKSRNLSEHQLARYAPTDEPNFYGAKDKTYSLSDVEEIIQ